MTHYPDHWRTISSVKNVKCPGVKSRVVKRSQLLAKITTYFVSIGQLICLAFLYGWHFLNKISLDWLFTLTTQLSTSKLSDNPAKGAVYKGFLCLTCLLWVHKAKWLAYVLKWWSHLPIIGWWYMGAGILE